MSDAKKIKDKLATYVWAGFQKAVIARTDITSRINTAMQFQMMEFLTVNGGGDKTEIAWIEEGHYPGYFDTSLLDRMLKQKVELAGVYVNPVENVWGIEAPPLSEEEKNIPPNELSMKKEAVENLVHEHTRIINKQFDEGRFDLSLSEVLSDLCHYPAACLKMQYRSEKTMEIDRTGFTPRAVVKEVFRPVWLRVHPDELYPAQSSHGVNDDGLFHYYEISRPELERLRNVKGYDTDAIDEILEDFEEFKHTSASSADNNKDTREILEERNRGSSTSQRLRIVEMWDAVPKKLMAKWGVESTEEEDDEEYIDICSFVVEGRYVIKAVVNPDPLGEKPYYVASYLPIPGAFWGLSMLDLGQTAHMMLNRMSNVMLKNAEMAGGPMTRLNAEAFPDGEDPGIKPFGTFVSSEQAMMSGGKAVEVISYPSTGKNLQAIMDELRQSLDTLLATTPFQNEGSAATNTTASGMAMQQTSRDKGVRYIAKQIDNKLIKPAVTQLYRMNISYPEDFGITDIPLATIVARGSDMLLKDQMQAGILNNGMQVIMSGIFQQTLQGLTGLEGNIEILKTYFKANRIPVDIDELMRKFKEQQAMQAQQQAMQAQMGQIPSAEGGVVGQPGRSVPPTQAPPMPSIQNTASESASNEPPMGIQSVAAATGPMNAGGMIPMGGQLNAR